MLITRKILCYVLAVGAIRLVVDKFVWNIQGIKFISGLRAKSRMSKNQISSNRLKEVEAEYK